MFKTDDATIERFKIEFPVLRQICGLTLEDYRKALHLSSSSMYNSQRQARTLSVERYIAYRYLIEDAAKSSNEEDYPLWVIRAAMDILVDDDEKTPEKNAIRAKIHEITTESYKRGEVVHYGAAASGLKIRKRLANEVFIR